MQAVKREILFLKCLVILSSLLWSAAWYCTQPLSQKELVLALINFGDIKSDSVGNAMEKVDRQFYQCNEPYSEFPKPIGYGALISAPMLVAVPLELLKDHLKPGNKALDIGSGTGSVTACMAVMLGDAGLAIGIDHIPQLVEQARNNVMRGNPDLVHSGRIKFVVGDGRLGYAQEGPYDAIHVDGSMEKIPDILLQQMKNGGRMVIPVGDRESLQALTVVDKDENGRLTNYSKENVYYVPLTRRLDQLYKREY